MKKVLMLIAVCFALMVSCSKNGQICEKVKMEFYASGVKSTLNGTAIEWQSGDEISIFDGVNNNRFVTSKSGASAVFTGEAKTASKYYAVYPYSLSSTYTSSIFGISVPSFQEARLNTFDPKANIAVGVSSGKNLHLKNVCGYIKLGISESGKYKSVKVVSEGGEPLSGNASVVLNADDLPVVSPASDALSYAVIVSESGTLDAGTYFIPVFPGDFSAGLSVILTDSSNNLFRLEEPFAQVIKRSVPLYIGNVDVNASVASDSFEIDESLSDLNPEAGRTSTLIALNTLRDDVKASVKSGATLSDVKVEKISNRKFRVSFKNNSETPEDFNSATIVFSSEGKTPIEATIRQNARLVIGFGPSFVYSPDLPGSSSLTPSTHSFSQGSRNYQIGLKLYYHNSASSAYLLIKHYLSDEYGYLEFPAISGLILRKVFLNFKSHTVNKTCSLEIRDSAGLQYSECLSKTDISTSYTDSLVLGTKNEPAAGVAYRLVATANKNCLVNSFELVYE